MIDNRILTGRAVAAIAITGFVFAVVAFIGAGYMQRAYMSTASVLSAIEDTDNSLSRVTNQLGGAVAGLLGVGVGGARRDVNESLATLRSRRLISEFIAAEDFLDDILDLLGPEQLANLSEEDRLQEAVSYFASNILAVSYDNRTTLMVIAVTWIDRQRAAQLANNYISFANEAMRARGIASARNRIEFLNKAAAEAATVELRTAIYRLVEAQVNAEMMAATKPDFAFVVVDPAVPAGVNEFVRPQTFLMALVAAMFGAGLATTVVLLRRKRGGSRPQS